MECLLVQPGDLYSIEAYLAASRRLGWRLSLLTVPKPPFAYDAAGFAAVILMPQGGDDAAAALSALAGRRFDAVVPGGEFAVILADRLASRLSCPHNPLDRVESYRDKALMRQAFARHGVEQPAILGEFASPAEAAAFDWSAIRFPVIVKPVDLAGSLHVRLCHEPAEVESVLRRIFMHSASFSGQRFAARGLIEEVAEGDEYSIECVVEDGALLDFFVTRKLVSRPPQREEMAHVCGLRLRPDVETRLLANLERIIAAWGVRAAVLHVECKIDAGRIRIIEGACRVGGDRIPVLVELTYGINLEECFLRARAGLSNRPALAGRRHHPERLHAIKFLFPETRAVEPPPGVELVRGEGPREGAAPGAGFGINRRLGYRIVGAASATLLDPYVAELCEGGLSLADCADGKPPPSLSPRA